METKILIFLAALAAMATFFLIVTYVKLINERAEHKKAKMINAFFMSITAKNSYGPSLGLLIKMDLEILRSLEYQLADYYRRNFLSLVIKSALAEIEPYIKDINELPESPQKVFIKETLKKGLFAQPRLSLTNFIFRTIKISNSANHSGLIEFLFGDVEYLQEHCGKMICIFNECKNLFKEIHVEDELKALMIRDFDELIRITEQNQ